MSERKKIATAAQAKTGMSNANKVGLAVVVVVVAACVAFFVMQLGSAGESSLKAVVHDSNGGIVELPLSVDAEQTVTTDLGTNVVVVHDGAVFVREADCENLDCLHQGRLSAPGKQIICLPHKLWIEVVGAHDQGGSMNVDAVAEGDGGYDVVAR